MEAHHPPPLPRASALDEPPLVKRSLKEELLKPRYRDAFGPVVSAVLLEQGLAAQLCNSLYEQEERAARDRAPTVRGPTSVSLRANASPLPDPEPTREELSVVAAMRDKWAAQLHATLAHHCEETGQPLMRLAQLHDGNMIRARAGRGPRWLFTSDDVIALLESAQHPNHVKARGGARSWCLTPLELSTSRLAQLRDRFAELAPTERQGGLDDELRGWFGEERYTIGKRLLAKVRRVARAPTPPTRRTQAQRRSWPKPLPPSWSCSRHSLETAVWHPSCCSG